MDAQQEDTIPASEETKPVPPTAPESETTVVNNPPAPQNKKPFPVFGKVMIGIAAIALLLFGGYYLGSSKKSSDTVTPTPAPTKAIIEQPTQAMKQEVSPTIGSKKTVKAGLTDGSTSFKPYMVEIPADWTDKHETTNVSDKLIISKNGYTINILQAAFGGGTCTYKGDPPAEMSQTFTDFTDIAGKEGQYRRSWNTGGEYTICQKNPTGTSYGSPTKYGAISAKSPSPADATTLSELDSIIASITKQ